MMMKKGFMLIVFCCANVIYCQKTEIVSGKFNFHYKKVIENSKNFEFFTSNTSVVVKDDNFKKIQIRFRVNSISNKRTYFDPNKFSLVVKENKFRVRPVDVKYNYIASQYQAFLMVDSRLKKKKKYKNLKDTFLDYNIEGYKNISFKININGRVEKVFYAGKKLRRNVVDVYFSVPKDFKKGDIYFGYDKIASFIIK